MSEPISITIRLPVETLKFAHGVHASCPLLDAACVGGSTGDALTELASHLKRQLVERFESGRFDDLFRWRGYSASEKCVGSTTGRYLDIELKLGITKQSDAMRSSPRGAPSEMLSTWMT